MFSRVYGCGRPLLLRQLCVNMLWKSPKSDAIDVLVLDTTLAKTKDESQLRRGVINHDLRLVKKTTQSLLREINELYDSVLCVDIKTLNREQLDNLVQNSVDEAKRNDLLYLANECMKWDKKPSNGVVLNVLDYFRDANQLQFVEQFSDFCVDCSESNFVDNASINFYKIKLYWTEGNVDKALSLLEKIHQDVTNQDEDNVALLSCTELFMFLIEDVVGQKSEAILLKLIHLIETLEDVSILEKLWQQLFSSTWFSDQQLAVGLFKRHTTLRSRLSMQANYITFLLLRDHNVDAVYRLVELLLAHQMLHECKKVLGLLFDYQFWRKDLRTCSEIIQTCISLDMPLPTEYDRKLLLLLLTPKQRPGDSVKQQSPKKPPSLEYKF